MATTAAKAFPWLESLQRSLDNNPDPTSRWPSLATINAKTQPTARIVAFRGFVKDHIDEAAQKNINPAILNSIIFTTDARSAKIEELQQRRDAALCWYFQDTREQHRFQGTMRIVAGPEWEWREKELSGWNDCGVDWEEVRRAEYAKMSPTMKATFTHPPPKSPLLANTAYEAALTDTASPAQHAAALKNFALLVFKVHEADRLDLRPQPYLRELGGSREGSEEWESAEVCP
ncbi:pyridoxamine 5'-phosphate oxidase-domain-containing protein [Fimicolochytrium jonesii]|uniref:pyridoxamine 5'-phosphate oxidase-domain-containing protein n=1 Tax=Fimicolochytrium jonesii TaxID=1396493 RepID=UPI0022FE5BB7|nr:pyridoxamine 5'-phosphate oxidase-domain-containing protein [Fimicolochytrium jonesii]KAI8825037.1 pyridoxamine 5'-phosphate oxidase-domain-containing protein [Fimicolochytrium jonesii]